MIHSVLPNIEPYAARFQRFANRNSIDAIKQIANQAKDIQSYFGKTNKVSVYNDNIIAYFGNAAVKNIK